MGRSWCPGREDDIVLEGVLPSGACSMKLHIVDLVQTDSDRYPRRVQCLLLKQIAGRATRCGGGCQGALIAVVESFSIRIGEVRAGFFHHSKDLRKLGIALP